MQIVSSGGNLMKCQILFSQETICMKCYKPIFWENKKNIVTLLSAVLDKRVEPIGHRMPKATRHLHITQQCSMLVCLSLSFTTHSTLTMSYGANQLTYSHYFLGTLSPLRGWPVLCAHTFASNWQLPILKRENDHRNYFMIIFTKIMWTSWDSN